MTDVVIRPSSNSFIELLHRTPPSNSFIELETDPSVCLEG